MDNFKTEDKNAFHANDFLYNVVVVTVSWQQMPLPCGKALFYPICS